MYQNVKVGLKCEIDPGLFLLQCFLYCAPYLNSSWEIDRAQHQNGITTRIHIDLPPFLSDLCDSSHNNISNLSIVSNISNSRVRMGVIQSWVQIPGRYLSMMPSVTLCAMVWQRSACWRDPPHLPNSTTPFPVQHMFRDPYRHPFPKQKKKQMLG